MPTSIGNNFIQFDNGLSNPNSVIKAEPVYRSVVEYHLPSAASTYVINDIPLNDSFYLYFTDVRSSATAFLRYRWSTDNGSSWSSYIQISQTANWSSSGVWGNVSRIVRQNTILTRITGSKFETSTGSGTNLTYYPEKIDDGFFPANVNAIELSFSSGTFLGGSTGFYNIFFMYTKRDCI